MAITNHERVGKALDLFRSGIGPYAEREIKSAVASGALSVTGAAGIVVEMVDTPASVTI